MQPSRTWTRAPLILGLTAALLVAAPLAWGRIGGGEGPEPPSLGTSVTAVPSPLPAPGRGVLRLEVKIPTGYHIFSDESLAVHPPSIGGVVFGKAEVPRGRMEEDRPVLRGTVVISIPVTLDAGAAPRLKGAFSLDWQACEEFGEKVCFLPITDSVPFEVKTAAAPAAKQAGMPSVPEVPNPGEPVPAQKAGPASPPGPPAVAPPAPVEKAAPAPAPEPSGYQARFARAAKGNVPLALLLAFLFGILSSLTPCVYPVIPITVAYIGSRSEGKGRSAGFFLSLAFVAGLALVYAALGAVSATAGQAFGSLTQRPWVGLPIAALFFVLSLSTFNLFEFKTPSFLANRLEATKQKGRGRGFLGAFLIGALSGLVASPCIGPLILAILVVVAATGSVVLGFVYLFAFALGMGVLFVVIGTFSGVLASLPKSGGWMDGVRILFGALILAAAFYFAGLYLPRPAFWLAAGLALGFVAGFLLFGAARHFFPVAYRLAGVALCAAALLAVTPALPPPPASAARAGVAWATDLDAGLAAGRDRGREVLLDFRADWCVACVELERETWPDPRVQRALAGMVPVRLDMTKNTEANRALQARFGVLGLPTVILVGPDGKERGRFTGFKDPDAFLAWRRGLARP